MTAAAIDLSVALAIDGWMTEDELRWLADRAAEMDRVGEIGCWLGRSTAAIAAACPGHVWTIDHFKGAASQPERQADARVLDLERTARANLARFFNLKIFTMSSEEAAEITPEGFFDMVFIDADHSYEAVRADIVRWRPRCTRLICGHDYEHGWPGVMRAVDELYPNRRRGPGSIWYMPLGRGQ